MKLIRNIATIISVIAISIVTFITFKELSASEGFDLIGFLLVGYLFYGGILCLLYYGKKTKYATALNWAAFILSISPIILMIVVFMLYISHGGC